MRGCLEVHGDRVGAGLGELLDLPFGALDHEVHVEHAARPLHLAGERFHDQRADGDRRNEVAVHHIHMDNARTGVHHLGHVLTES